MGKTGYFATESNVGAGPHEGTPGGSRLLNAVLRLLAIVFSISGLVVMATDKEDGTTPIYFLNTQLSITKTAYYSMFTAFKFLVWANAIAAAVALIQLVAVAAFGGHSRIRGWVTLLFDQAVAYLLLAAAASSTEVAYLAKNGLDYIGWSERCSHYDKFCTRAGIALFLTFCSTGVFAGLAMMSAHRSFSRLG